MLRDITERALNLNEQSRIRLKTLGLMEEKLLQKNTEMLHLYEKIKYMVTLFNKISRKDKHYGFNIWREECRGAKRISNILETAFCRIVPNNLKKTAFHRWNKSSSMMKRLEVAGMLLTDFENTK